MIKIRKKTTLSWFQTRTETRFIILVSTIIYERPNPSKFTLGTKGFRILPGLSLRLNRRVGIFTHQETSIWVPCDNHFQIRVKRLFQPRPLPLKCIMHFPINRTDICLSTTFTKSVQVFQENGLYTILCFYGNQEL